MPAQARNIAYIMLGQPRDSQHWVSPGVPAFASILKRDTYLGKPLDVQSERTQPYTGRPVEGPQHHVPCTSASRHVQGDVNLRPCRTIHFLKIVNQLQPTHTAVPLKKHTSDPQHHRSSSCSVTPSHTRQRCIAQERKAIRTFV